VTEPVAIDDALQERASLYALGALDREESRAFEALLRDSAQLRALVKDLRGVTEQLAASVPALEPPAALRSRLLTQISRSRGPARGVWIPWALAAGLALLSLGFIYQSANLKVRLSAQVRRVEELRTSLIVAQSENGELRHTVARLRESNQLAAVRIALLDSMNKSDPKAVAVSVWDNDRQDGLFIVRNLKPAPPDKDYQLWVIDPKYPTPVDAGVFKVDEKGDARQEFHARQPIASANQFAVTLEKKGGANVPDTKAMVLAGT
jgi:anti-sigma-K factor RskA